jgi:hypothetical protein
VRELIFCTLVLFAAGCTPDPLGMTSRTQIRAAASVQIAEQERMAEEAKAKALVDAEIARQAGRKQMTATIMMILGFIAVVLGGFWVITRIISARKEIEIERLRLGGISPAPRLPREIKLSLDRRGWSAEWDGKDYWAVDQSGQRLSTFTHLLEVKR